MQIAHIKMDKNGHTVIQSLYDHIRNTAAYAAENLRELNLYHTGYLAGLLHDMGKASAAFKTYITAAFNGEPIVRGSVNHTFAGVIYLSELTANRESVYKIAYELIAFAIGSHHGLFDAFSPDGVNGYLHRTVATDRNKIHYDEAKSQFLKECASEDEIESLLIKAKDELIVLNNKIKAASNKSKQHHRYYLGLAARLLTSALIDADRRDTAEFFGAANRDEVCVKVDMRLLCSNLETVLSRFSADTPVNAARQKISDICKKAAKNKSGVYRLTVPTGAGKTLSVMRYATEHCRLTGKKRIIYTAPLLTIIEQNADVIRRAVGEDYVLEHHSDIVKTDMDSDELSVFELLTESWDSPITVTTMVQLLNTLFSADTACIRRFRSLCGSVIIIDEIQSLPLDSVSIMNGAVNFLSDICNATIILCSATQPGFASTPFPLKYAEQHTDIVPLDASILTAFDRTAVINKTDRVYSDEQIAALCEEKLADVNSVLLICNTKTTAKNVFDYLEIKRKNASNAFKLFHLSASMCRAHRSDILEKIKATLGQEPLICISTQIIEAGVDISFENVVRILAGIDSIAQAAGRCNRNFDFGRICEVDIIKSRDEKLSHLKDIQNTQTAALYTLNETGGDCLGEASIQAYYKHLYRLAESKLDYPAETNNIHTSLLDMLSSNQALTLRKSNANAVLNQSFKTAGKLFKIFDENTTDVIVPYNDEAISIITDLTNAKAQYHLGYVKSLLTKAKPYTVSVYEYTLRCLKEVGAVTSLYDDAVNIIDKRFYDTDTGLTKEKNGSYQTAIF